MILNGSLFISYRVTFYLLKRERERERIIIYIDISYNSERENLKNIESLFLFTFSTKSTLARLLNSYKLHKHEQSGSRGD
nr:MAG TPA: hypothetical protein [Caudoviricetes sp.]